MVMGRDSGWQPGGPAPRLTGLSSLWLPHPRPRRASPCAGAASTPVQPDPSMDGRFPPAHPRAGWVVHGQHGRSLQSPEVQRMRRIVTTVFLAACAALAVGPAAHAQSLLFDYVGFDYAFPNPNPAAFGEPGSGYAWLGTVPLLAPPPVTNPTLNEYKYVMQGLTPSSL